MLKGLMVSYVTGERDEYLLLMRWTSRKIHIWNFLNYAIDIYIDLDQRNYFRDYNYLSIMPQYYNLIHLIASNNVAQHKFQFSLI